MHVFFRIIILQPRLLKFINLSFEFQIIEKSWRIHFKGTNVDAGHSLVRYRARFLRSHVSYACVFHSSCSRALLRFGSSQCFTISIIKNIFTRSDRSIGLICKIILSKRSLFTRYKVLDNTLYITWKFKSGIGYLKSFDNEELSFFIKYRKAIVFLLHKT